MLKRYVLEQICYDIFSQFMDLTLSSYIFNTVKMTKMRDTLPIRLFNPENFITLEYGEMYTECPYFLLFTLLLASLSMELTQTMMQLETVLKMIL